MPLFHNVLRLGQLDIIGRRVFLRADLDVPVSPHGAVLDDGRLRLALPTLRGLVAARCKVIVGAHYGTAAKPAPQGAPEGAARRLGELMGIPIGVLDTDFARQIRLMEEGQVLLTPNLATYTEENDNQAAWAKSIARVVDVYVGNAVRAAREPWASTVALPRAVPARGAGPLLAAELDNVRDFVEAPSSPYTAVIGGKSVVKRAAFIHALLLKIDSLLLGGAVANTFLVADGWNPRKSLYEEAGVEVAREILKAARSRGVDVRFPLDAVVASRPAANAPPTFALRAIDGLGANEEVVDIAIDTCSAYREVLVRSATVLWNGLMGDCTSNDTQSGTYRVAQASTEASPYTLMVGESTLRMANFFDMTSQFRNIGTGGAASLALLQGIVFPGIESLRS